jgi:hypothetical protein
LGQKVEDYEGVEILVFRPERALAWNVLNEDATAWDLREDGDGAS